MSGDRGYNYKNRRKKADWVINAATILSVISWFFAMAVWVLIDMAAPETENFFTHLYDLTVRTWWDTGFLSAAFVLLILSFVTCVIAFIFNATRMRRKTDKYRKSIIIIGVITFFGLLAFLLRFGFYIF